MSKIEIPVSLKMDAAAVQATGANMAKAAAAGAQAAAAQSQGAATEAVKSGPFPFSRGTGLATPPTDFSQMSAEQRRNEYRRRIQESIDEERGRAQAAAELALERQQKKAEAMNPALVAQQEIEKAKFRKQVESEKEKLLPPPLPQPAPGVGGQLAQTLGGYFMRMVGPTALVTSAMVAMHKAVRNLTDAFEDGRRTYAKTLQSGGLSMGFVAQRSNLAQIIGVGESEVYNYGQAVNFLNGKLAMANEVSARTAPELAATAWEMGVLKANMNALFLEMASRLGPELRKMINGFSELAKKMQPMVGNIAEGLSLLLKQVVKSQLVLLTGPASEWIGDRIFGGGKDTGAAPAPVAGMNRTPMSAWERMGLVASYGAGNNPAQETARNTRKTNEILTSIHRNMMPRGGEPQLNQDWSRP